MLNGVAPVLIVNLIKKADNSAAKFFSGIPLIGGDLGAALTGGLPIPIYLDEGLTGIVVKGESKAIAVENEVKAKTEGGKPKTNQRAVDSNVTINMLARKDSVMLAALIALNDQIFQRLASKEYSVSYLNGSTIIFNGLFSGFTSMNDENSDLLHITLTLSKGNQETTKPDTQNPVIQPSAGAIPLPQGA